MFPVDMLGTKSPTHRKVISKKWLLNFHWAWCFFNLTCTVKFTTRSSASTEIDCSLYEPILRFHFAQLNTEPNHHYTIEFERKKYYPCKILILLDPGYLFLVRSEEEGGGRDPKKKLFIFAGPFIIFFIFPNFW